MTVNPRYGWTGSPRAALLPAENSLRVPTNVGKLTSHQPFRPFEMRFREVGPFEMRFPEVGPFEMRFPEVGPFEMRSPEAGSFKMRSPEVGSFKMRSPEVGSFEMRSHKIRSPEVASSQVKMPAFRFLSVTVFIVPAENHTEHCSDVGCRLVIGLCGCGLFVFV
jgi:hypothetical protein